MGGNRHPPCPVRTDAFYVHAIKIKEPGRIRDHRRSLPCRGRRHLDSASRFGRRRRRREGLSLVSGSC
jgi:hypothetical protein